LTTKLARATLRILLLTLTTTSLRRTIVPLVVFFVWAPAAQAWSWPVQGPVLQPFSYDESHPYAAGQHRGIDIGAAATGQPVRAPVDGTVSFAGSVPTNGESVTIETADGFAVTLTHLGSITVAKGTAVAEGDEVGTIGPSGTAETDVPYVHLGIRTAADPDGYVDPLSFLPPIPDSTGSESTVPTPQPSAGGGSSSATAPVSAPAPAPQATSSPVAASQGATVQADQAHAQSRERGRAHSARPDVKPHRSSQRPRVSHAEAAEPGAAHHPRVPHRHVAEPVSASRRPAVEVVVPPERTDLDAGHELQPAEQGARASGRPGMATPALLGLVLNGAAALVAVAAALAAGRRRNRAFADQVEVARVVPLPRPTLGENARRAA
jgi:hypothetical protein